MLIQSLEGVITASGASELTFDQVMAQLGAQVSLDYLFGTAVSPGAGQTGITNLTQLATYFNAWGDSMIPPSWGDTPQGINGENFNSDMERFQAFNATNHVFTAGSLALTAVNEQVTSFQTSITTGTSGTTFTLPAAVPIATLGFASTAAFAGTGGTGGVSSVSLVIASVAQGGLYQGNQVSGPGVPAGTHVVNAPAGNGAGTYTLSQAVTIATGSAITSANAPVVGQVLCSMFRGFYQITAVTAGTSLTLAPILGSNGTNVAFNNATVLLPYYYTTLSATLTTGATGASLASIPTGVVNGMMFAVANGSSVVSNSTSRITISGSNVTFDNPWTYDEPTFPVGQGVLFMQPITSAQIWSNTYYLPTATNWVAFDEYVTFPTDSAGGQNLLSNTTALTITNAAQIAAVPTNFAWGAFPSCWMYGGNFPTAGQFDTSEVDFITTRYYPPQGPWTNVMGFFNSGNTATVSSLNPPAVTSTTTAGQGANEFLTSAATPTDLILYSGASLAGAHRISTLWTSNQVQTFVDNVPTATINYTWTGAGYAQLGIQNCVGTFASSGRDLSFPLLAANFPSYVTSVSRIRVLGPPATNVLTNGASFIVTGSGFGTKSTLAGETFFDDMSSSTMATGPWTLIRPFYNSPSSSDGWTEQYRTPATVTPAGDTWGTTAGCIVPTATPFRTHYISGACNAVNQGGYARSSPMFGKVFPTAEPPFYLVCSWYEAVSPSWKFGSAYGYHGQGDNNFKWTNYTNSVESAYTYSPGGSSSQYMYMEWGNSEFTSANATPTIDINDDGGTKTGQLPGGGEYHSPSVPSKYYTGINGWVKKEWIAYYTSATTGFIQMAVSQPPGLNAGAAGGTTPGSTRFSGYLWNAGPNGSGQTDGYGNNPQTGSGRSFFLGGFRRNFPQNANRSYWSDVYISRDLNGVGRFVITNTNSLTTSTIFEWQPYTSWSNTSVTLTCNKGNLASGTVYVWYMDEINGNQLIGSYTMN